MAVSNKSTARKVEESQAKQGARATASRQSAKKAASKSTGQGRKTDKKVATAKKGTSIEELNEYQDHLAFKTGIAICVILIVSVFLYLCYFRLAGNAGLVTGGLFFGVFGWFAWFLPLACLIGYVFCTVNKGDKRVPRKLFGFGGIVLSLLGLTDLLFGKQIITEYYTSNHVLHRNYFECMYLTVTDVMTKGKFNGGLCGRAVGTVFSTVIGKIGASVILFALLFFCLYIFYGVELMGEIRKRNAYRQEMEEAYGEISQEEEYQEPSYRVFTNTRHEVRHNRFQPRDMKKVPKVQSFDLRKINGAVRPKPSILQGGAKALAEAGKSTGKASEKLFDQNRPGKEKPEDAVLHADKAVEKEKPVAMVKETDVSEENGVTAAMQEEIATKEMQSRIDDIPIYRNELDEKFRKKKKAENAVLVPAKEATEDSRPVRDKREQSHTKEPIPFKKEAAEDFAETISFEEKATEDVKKLSEDAEEEKQDDIGDAIVSGEKKATDVSEPMTFGAEEAEPVSVKAEEALPVSDETEDSEDVFMPDLSLEEEAVLSYEEPLMERAAEEPAQKPMASFVHKEEVTDVTPHGRRVSGGKIGGDDYVSASDTFNALNESKVSAEEERPYEFPSLQLLSLPKSSQGSVSDGELRTTALKLQETLKSFNVNVKMGAVTCGPAVTRYELFPEQGVRVNKITNLADDLRLSLAAASIRIEAPIPGKAAVGIEIPNPVPSPVFFRELLEGDTFSSTKSAMTFAVGKDIAGKVIMADIAKMPHLLIAGATGSGKSVCINTLIMSILYKADPKDVKLIMIDPKVVELSVYNGIPHLFCPVVTDPKEAAAALNWAVREMMDRYNKFKELGVRNIAGYNDKIKDYDNAEEAGYARMPYLVVIVDEFADLMMVASKEVEDAVCRLAQLARAAGIHLVLATQRPSVNVITGVIKANIPSRIAFSVSSVIDSRTILDKGGAEKLLGKGDMLFFPSGYSEPIRVQGAFVSDKEVSDVVDFLCSNNDTPEYNHAVTEIVDEPKEEEISEKKTQSDRDEYFADAGRFVIESGRAAAGQLQRRFSIGFNRAGRIIDQLNKAGVVGPAEGTKPRKVLMEMEEFEQMLSGKVPEEEIESMVREMEEESVVTLEI